MMQVTDPVEELVRIEVRLAREFLAGIGRALSASPAGSVRATIRSDYGFKWPAHAPAFRIAPVSLQRERPSQTGTSRWFASAPQ